jgi:hypothetical protein
MADQLPADAGQHQADVAEPEGDQPPAFDASDADWESLGIAPDEAPDSPDGYGLVGSGDPEVDAVLEGMARDGDEVLDAFAERAHALNLSHAQFAGLAAWYVGQHVHNATTWDGAAEVLGGDASKIVDDLERFSRSYLSARTQQLLQSAQPHPLILSLLQDMQILSGHLPAGSPDDNAVPSAEGPPVADKKDLQKLMASEAYRKGDKRVVAASSRGSVTGSKLRKV